jgi:hypothetical protein
VKKIDNIAPHIGVLNGMGKGSINDSNETQKFTIIHMLVTKQ